MHRVRPVLYSGCLLGLLLCSAVVCEADLPQKPSDLSVRQLIALAYEYSWHEDPWTERALLEQAAARPPGADTARAKALLAECYFVSGQTQEARALLRQLRRQYSNPELLAFVSLIDALGRMTPVKSTHSRKLRAEAEACRRLYADAADRWKGTFLGGWASIRLAAVYRVSLNEPEKAVGVLERTIQDYAGTTFGDYGEEELAAVISFSVHRRDEGRRRYEELLTSDDDFLQQRANLHLGELLMEYDNFTTSYDLLTRFVECWPQHAETSGARLELLYGSEDVQVQQGGFITRMQPYEVKVFASTRKWEADTVQGRDYQP